MMKAVGRVSVFGLCVATAAGCKLLDGPSNCIDDPRAAISLWVLDSITGEFAGSGARAIASDGEYADTSFADETIFPYFMARNRPGTYTLVVEKSGYQTWTRSGITAPGYGCHVQGVVVTALLQR